MSEQSPATDQYRCPGQSYPISRAVHLGRLARFYPPCRRCEHRQDHEPLSPRLKRRLAESHRQGEFPPLFSAEDARGVYWNQLTLTDARRLATALGFWLRQQPDSATPPTALVAGDARPLTPEIVAAVVEGLRWTGCHTIEIPAATAACTALAVSHLACDGGILVGNPAGSVQSVGLKFWAADGRPLSRGHGLESVEHVFQRGVDRPTRRFGSLRRFQAESPYLERLQHDYHGLRPLQMLLRSDCQPFGSFLQSLLQSTACRTLPCPAEYSRFPEQIRQHQAHFGIHVQDDAERCTIYDQRGQLVAPAHLAALVLEELLADEPATVVLDDEIAELILRRSGHPIRPIVCTSPSRAAMYELLQQHAALFGADAQGRFWYRLDESCWAADALQTLTLLLKHLSRSDQPLSALLDSPPPRD